MKPAPNPQQWEGSKNSEAHLSMLHQRQNIKEITQLFKVTQNI